MPEEAYTYFPLKLTSSFRLVRFATTARDLSAESTPEPRIELVLSEQQINESQVYHAVSYVWGSTASANLRNVYINNRSLQVTSNCYNFLLQQRLESESSVTQYFIDQISIDQSNLTERSCQVAMMGQIFSAAKKVISWLGPDVDVDLTSGLKAWRQLESIVSAIVPCWKKQIAFFYNYEPVILALRGILEQQAEWRLDGPNWRRISRLASDAYFTRLWIVPEMILSRGFNLKAGATLMDGDTFLLLHRVIQNYEAAIHHLRPHHNMLHQARCDEGLIITRYARGLVDVKGYDLTWRIVYQRLAVLQASDERDYVYALLPLCHLSGCPVDFRPDYTLSSEQTCKRLAESLVAAGTQLDFLRLAGHCPTRAWPSWVPNPIADLAQMDARFLRISSLSYSAGGSTDSKFVFEEESNALICQGKVIDTICMLGTVFTRARSEASAMYQPGVGSIENQLITEIRSVLSSLPTLQDQDYIVASIFGALKPIIANSSFALSAFAIWWQQFTARLYSYDEQDPRLKQIRAVLANAGNDLAGFRLALTLKGFVCAVNAQTKIRDKICVLIGVGIPFVIRYREHPASYTLIRGCTVGGLMEGEVMDMQTVQTTAIVLH